MARYWAITIGINQYHHFQPLMYAQRDAQILNGALMHEGGFAPEDCLLLTDLSPALDQRSTYPTQEGIQYWLDWLANCPIQPDDVVWVFFSGYGTQIDGQDYLVPIDSDPTQRPETGMPTRLLFNVLKTLPGGQPFVILDMKQLPGDQVEQQLGESTAATARELDIPLLLAHKPGQASHETIALRQGLFTATLLEAIRSQRCGTLAQLTEYVRVRLPELSQHHWRPLQEIVAVLTETQQVVPILPDPEQLAGDLPEPTEPQEVESGESAPLPIPVPDPESGKPEPDETPEESGKPDELEGGRPPAWPDETPVGYPTPDPERPDPGSAAPSPVPVTQEQSSSELEGGFWGRIGLWGFLIALALILAVILRNLSTFWRFQPNFAGWNWPAKVEPVPDADSDGAVGAADGSAPDAAGDAAVDSGEAADSGETLGETPDGAEATGAADSSDQGETGTENSTPEQAASTAPDAADGAANPQLEQARQAIAAGQYQTALEQLNQIPPVQQNQAYQALKAEAEQGVEQAQGKNQAVLDEAQQQAQGGQASDLSRAIATARNIKPGQPLYTQAQQNIDDWSQDILDVAQQRADQGQRTDAIAAAKLVPSDRPTLAKQAQGLIDQWGQTVSTQESQGSSSSKAVIQKAKGTIQPGQAHSYQNAIAAVRKISSDQPGHAEAQKLADQWSQDILAIARQRAAEGRVSSAVLAVILIPPETAAYSEAQQALAAWKQELAR